MTDDEEERHAEDYMPFSRPVDRKTGRSIPVKHEGNVGVENAVVEPGTIDTNPSEIDESYVVVPDGERVAQVFYLRSSVSLTEFAWTLAGLRFKLPKGAEVEETVFGVGSPGIEIEMYDTDLSDPPEPDSYLGLKGRIPAERINQDGELSDPDRGFKWTKTDLEVDPGEEPVLDSENFYALVFTNETGYDIKVSKPSENYPFGYYVGETGGSWNPDIESDISAVIEWSQKKPLEVEGDLGEFEADVGDVSISSVDDENVITGVRVEDLYNAYFTADGTTSAASADTANTEYANLIDRDSTTELKCDSDDALPTHSAFELDYSSYAGEYLDMSRDDVLKFSIKTKDKDFLAESPAYTIHIEDDSGDYYEWEILKKNVEGDYLILPLGAKPTIESGTLDWTSVAYIRLSIHHSEAFLDDVTGTQTIAYLEMISSLNLGISAGNYDEEGNLKTNIRRLIPEDEVSAILIERDRTTYTLADSENISGGVSQSLESYKRLTFVLDCVDSVACNITVEASLDEGTSWTEIQESPISLDADNNYSVFETLGYDVTDLKFTSDVVDDMFVQILEVK